MRFLKNVLATILGLFLFTFIFIGIIAIFASRDDKKVDLKKNTVLKLDLDKPILEWVDTSNPFEELGLMGFSSPISLIELKNSIKNAKSDDRIKGIYLELSGVSTGFAVLEEIRESLIDFKSGGKFIVAYGTDITEGAYYIASVADEIYLNPSGSLEFDGFRADLVFLKGFFDKIGVKPEVFRVGDFKSAVEPFIRKDMSPENRLQTQAYVDTLFNVYITNIARSRNLPANILKDLSNEASIQKPMDAIKAKLVTDTAYKDQVVKTLKNKMGIEEDNTLEMVSLRKYQKAEPPIKAEYSNQRVAVIIAEGEIRRGENMDGVLGADALTKEIKKAREDDKVKAIVLRVNSPGGEFMASDNIWREISLTTEKKPVIASMSSVAASGGYYIAMNCDKIFAQPNTITGSIGAFALTFNAKELLTNKLGFTFDKVQTGEYSNFLNPFEELSNEERKIVQNGLERAYGTFVGKAASGRGMTVDSLEKVASGRVWTGIDALKLGLIDEIGGIDQAIAMAAEMAELEADDYQILYLPKKKDFFTALLESSNVMVKNYYAKQELGELYPFIQQLNGLTNMKQPMMLMPYEIKLY